MGKIIIVGGGAAGMLAAIVSARQGHRVCLYEKNEKLGKKLFITGKGRCNITNACDMEELFYNIRSNSKFLYSAFYGFSNYDMMQLLEDLGLRLKIERGGRVFPVSDKSSDVIGVLKKELERMQVNIVLNCPVKKVLTESQYVTGVLLENARIEEADAVLIATGGISYPSTGSTGDGYKFAEETGHSINKLYPGLVPFETKEVWVKELQGLSLKNIEICIRNTKKELYRSFGEMLFTHFGVSGPVIISASSYVTKELQKEPLVLIIDLKPALTLEQLDARLVREFEQNKNKAIKNVMNSLLPSKMIPVMLQYLQINPDEKINQISKEKRIWIAKGLKGFTCTLTGLRGWKEAIITRGGVSTKEINPTTMESKKIHGLYFAGEVLDVDALTGGFNLQIAWSTGYAAGIHMGCSENK